MGFEGPKMPSPEEVAKIEKSRALSDEKLLRGGAKYKVGENGEKTLEVTEKQVKGAIKEEVFDVEIEAHEAIKAGREYIRNQEKRVEEIANDYLTYGGILGSVAALGGIAAGFAMDSPTAFWAGTATVVAGPLAGYLSGKFKQYSERNKLEKQKEEQPDKERQIKKELAKKIEKLES